MARLPTTYDHILAIYPDAVKAIVDLKNKSTSKDKNMLPQDMKWEFDWFQQCEACNPFDPNYVHEEIDWNLTPKEKLDKIAPMLGVYLVGKAGRGKWMHEIVFLNSKTHQLPQVIQDSYIESFTKENEDHKRFEALSPEEQQKEINGILNKLGFHY